MLGSMRKSFRPYDPRQQLLLPPNLADWLPEDHLARFVGEVVDTLDLTEVYAAYQDGRGTQPYHPTMMVKVLVYGYCIGVRSSTLSGTQPGRCSAAGVPQGWPHRAGHLRRRGLPLSLGRPAPRP